MIKRVLSLLAWQDWPPPPRAHSGLRSPDTQGVRRVDGGKLLVVRSRDVQCPHCRKAIRLDVRELRLVDVVGAGGQVMHSEVD